MVSKSFKKSQNILFQQLFQDLRHLRKSNFSPKILVSTLREVIPILYPLTPPPPGRGGGTLDASRPKSKKIEIGQNRKLPQKSSNMIILSFFSTKIKIKKIGYTLATPLSGYSIGITSLNSSFATNELNRRFWPDFIFFPSHPRRPCTSQMLLVARNCF